MSPLALALPLFGPRGSFIHGSLSVWTEPISTVDKGQAVEPIENSVVEYTWLGITGMASGSTTAVEAVL